MTPAGWFLAAYVVGFLLFLRRATKTAEREADRVERIARANAETRQRFLDGLDYSPLSREAEAWLKARTR